MANESGWGRFCTDAARILRDARANKITLEEATTFFENSNAISNPDLRLYIERMIWEIDSEPDYYAELTKLFESNASQEEMVHYLDSDESFTQKLWSAIAFWRQT